MKYYLLILFSICLIQIGHTQDNKYLPKDQKGTVVKHKNYILNYREKFEQPSWVAYELTSTELKKAIKRTNDFRSDPSIKTKSAELVDYRSSGYDRGHLAPAADMSFSSDAMHESFYMSNMSPQKPQFNRGKWKILEEQVRAWAHKEGKLYIVTGPVLVEGLPTIGPNQVSIPKQYYKIVYDMTTPQKVIAFLMPNSDCPLSLSNYQTTIDHIEALTNIDFFSSLPDSQEDLIESKMNKNWSYSKSSGHHNKKPSEKNANKININKATLEKLKTLPGIGDKLAKEIIHHRPFYSYSDIKKIKGIGDKTISNIKDKICF